MMIRRTWNAQKVYKHGPIGIWENQISIMKLAAWWRQCMVAKQIVVGDVGPRPWEGAGYVDEQGTVGWVQGTAQKRKNKNSSVTSDYLIGIPENLGSM